VDASALQEAASEARAKGHFDTFETIFFQAGEEGGSLPGALDPLDDAGSFSRVRRPLLSPGSLLGLGIVSTCLAVLACTALWRSNAPLPPLPAAAAPPTKLAVVAAKEIPPSPEPAPAAAVPAASPAATEPTAVAAPPGAEPAAIAVEGKSAADDVANAEDASPAVAAGAHERCQQSIRDRRNKDILAFCPVAFAEAAGDADVAVAIAKVELDRGRYAQAYVWSKKAIAINPDKAEAYVFAGGAEQSKGHGKAAKEAYLHYLRLAPTGHYAAELRAVVRSL